MIDKEYIKINIATGKTFSYLEYHTDSIIKANNPDIYYTSYSFVKKIEIDNQTENDFDELIIHFEFSNDLFSCEDFKITFCPRRTKSVIKIDPKIKIDEKRLYELSGISTSTIFISLRDPNKDYKELCCNTKSVKILPITQATNDFFKAPLLFAKYCVTEFPSLINLQHQANLELAKINNVESDCLIGYGKSNEEDIIKELTSIYRALHYAGNITYSNPPNSTEIVQNIRMPNDVLKFKIGTCLDLSLLFCSFLLQVGYHPILVITQDHAFAGCFLHEYDSFDSYYETKPNVVFSDSTGEDKKLVLFECTGITNSSDVPFSESMEMANESLRAYRGLFFAIDIYRAQQSFFKPIPIPTEDGYIDFTLPILEMREEERLDIQEYQGSPIPESDTDDRFSTWEKKLLDLSTANKLVNFKFAKDSSNYALVIPPHGKGKELFDFLKESDGSCQLANFLSFFSEEDGKLLNLEDPVIKELSSKQIKNNTLIMTVKTKTMKSLIKKDSESREETGSPTLYLSIGLLKGVDSNAKGDKEILAPFLLLPVKITKNRYGDQFTVSYDIEDLMVNKTFFEYYKLKKGTDYDNLYTISCHNQFEDIIATLRENHSGDIQLDENVCFFANFLFTHMVMWQDIVDRKDVLRENVIIKSLLENKSFINDEPVEYENADELDKMNEFAAPLPYDSTQLRAIRECAKGNSFILDGPPGTGKSQTIVNMIVNAFYHGKSVLFVAEKQAALEVVRQRLASLGLDKFALQLYSSKTNKQAFFSQLNNTIEYGKKSSDDDFESVCSNIEEQKKVINDELRRLHSHKKYYYSLYEAITRQLASEHKVDCTFDLSEEFLEGYDAILDEKIRNIINRIEKLREDLIVNDDISSCYAYILFEKYDYHDQFKIASIFNELKSILTELKIDFDVLKENALKDVDLRYSNFDYIVELMDIILFKNVKYDVFSLNISNFDSFFETMSYAMDAIEKLYDFENEIKDQYNIDDILSVDGKNVKLALSKGTNIFNRWIARKKASKLLSSMLLTKRKLSSYEIYLMADTAIKYNSLKNETLKYTSELKEFFSEDILDNLSEFSKYKEIFDDTYSLYKLVKQGDYNLYQLIYSNIKAVSPFELGKTKGLYISFKESYLSFKNKLDEINSTYPIDINDSEDKLFPFFSKLITFFTDKKYQYLIDRYTKLLADYHTLEDLGLHDFVTYLRENEIAFGNIENTFEYNLSHAFILASFNADSDNNTFDEKEYEAVISKYQDLIKKYNSLCVGETIEKITSKFEDPDLKRSTSSPIGALRKLCMNSGKGISIRNTLSKFEDLIRMYFPCFLMSPLSAAQYLDVNSKKFDIVIFDEASQIPTSEAIGPIARGNSLIVAGDPKQMPPSEYFQVTGSIEDESLDGKDTLISDAESLLDDCLSIDMPRIRLAFHYRSKHESLICFSNHNFYGGDLFTFPSTDNLTSHISFIHVDSVDKKKGSDISTNEIQTILSVLKQLLDDEKTKNKSIGIIVFNSNQQEKLEDEIDTFLNSKQEYLSLTHWNEEVSPKRLFVKNLENVQGDERDIIIMSIGFLKSSDGKALINGPLALAKGERRLNVAASRSIEQMIVVSTIYASDIDETNKKNQGARHLKDFLRFAMDSSSYAIDLSNDSPNKDLAYFIADRLSNYGYECDISIGSSEFKVDLAVRKKDKKEYLLGILLDEKPLNGNVSCRDRFFVEPLILKSLKWKIVRVYTVSFLRYESQIISEIVEMIENLDKEENDDSLLYLPPVLNEHHVTSEDFGIVDYEYFDYEPISSETELTFEYGNYYEEMVSFLNDLVSKEFPISKNMIFEAVKKKFNIIRLTSKMVTIVDSHLKFIYPLITKDYEDSLFYWPSGETGRFEKFRESSRDITDIAKEEIIALMNNIIKVYQDIDKEELIRVTCEQMNINIITPKIRRKLEYVIYEGSNNDLFVDGYHESSYILNK